MANSTGFRKAKRRQVWIRLFTLGQSKNGKTYTSLSLGLHLADLMGLPPSAVGVIDSEVDDADQADQQGSAEKYEGDSCQCSECMGRGIVFEDFGTLLLTPGNREPEDYIRAIGAAKAQGIKVLVIDSLSHEWESCLEMVDRVKGSKFNQGWGMVTPLHNRVISSIKGYPGHVIVTMRAKEKFTNSTGSGGKKEVTSQGILPVQRPLIEYEFDFGMFMHQGNGQMVGARCASLNGKHYERPGLRLAKDLLDWSLRGDKAIRDRQAGDQRAAVAYGEQDPRETREQVKALLVNADAQLQAKVIDLLKQANADREKLGKLLAWLKTKVEAPEEGHAQQVPAQQQAPAAPQQQVPQQQAQRPPAQARSEPRQQQPAQQPGRGHPAQQQPRQAPSQQAPHHAQPQGFYNPPQDQPAEDDSPWPEQGSFVPGMGQTYGADPQPAGASSYTDFDPPA